MLWVVYWSYLWEYPALLSGSWWQGWVSEPRTAWKGALDLQCSTGQSYKINTYTTTQVHLGKLGAVDLLEPSYFIESKLWLLLETVPVLTPGTRLPNYLFWSLPPLFSSQGKCVVSWRLERPERGDWDSRIAQVDAMYIMSGKMEVFGVQVADFDS